MAEPRLTPPGPTTGSASEPLRRFLQVARGAGLRISAAEGIDAARAVDLVGFSNRAVLKETLSAVLAKTIDEKLIFEDTFDLYFRRDEFSAAEPPDEERDAAAGNVPQSSTTVPGAMGGGGGPSLLQLLEDGDRSELAVAMETAAHEARIDRIRYLTQKNIYVLDILNRMGLGPAQRDIQDLRAIGAPAATARADRLEARLEELRDSVRDFVERSLLLYARGETEQMRERLLKSARLANLDRHQLERMRVLVRQMAKRLATRYARTRRRRNRGEINVQRTIRRNMGWGGVPFDVVWKQKHIEKPRLMVLCDVSGSVAWVSQFLLMFLYALTEALSDIRSFAYAGSMIEVSEILEHQAFEEAFARIMSSVGFESSNYGSAFEDFEQCWMKDVNSKTTVIILGDARGNGTDPRVDIVERLSNRSRRLMWLNPEFRSVWGSGDSDMYRYAPYCSLVRVCSTLNDLERVITDLMESRG